MSSRIANIVIEARPKGTIYDRAKITATNGFYRSEDNVIVWNQITKPELAAIDPGDSQSLSFAIRTLRSALNLRSPSMQVEVTVRADRLDAGSTGTISTTVSKTIKIVSEMSYGMKLMRNNTVFPNTGPIPPKVDQESTYTVVLSVSNTTNDLSNVQLVTSLPIFTKWLNKISPEGSDLQFNDLGGGLVWNAGELKAGQTKEVSFQVAFVPSVTQLGGSPQLVNDATASGYDGFTGITIKAPYAQNYTSIELIQDPAFSGKGGPVTQ
jgi:hypothetical protein